MDFNYDSGGRLESITLPRGQIDYEYDSATGRLSSIIAPDSNGLAYTYDGPLPLTSTWAGSVAGSVSNTYNNDFQIISRSVNGGNTVNYTYDNDGLVAQAGSLAISYDAQNGLITGTDLGSLATDLGYNSFAELDDYNATYNGSVLFAAQYVRDKLGRITDKVENVDGTIKTTVYTYDTAGRLSEVTEDAAVTAQYQYDQNGNRLSHTTPLGSTSGVYDNQDRMTSYGNYTYTYTANGEMQSKTDTTINETTVYHYDLLGNLMDVILPDGTRIDYIVDGQNRRIGKIVDGNLEQGFLYKDQLNPIAELDGSGNVVSRFIYVTKSNVPDYFVKGGATYRIISDHVGSPRLVIDTATGAVVQEIEYDEFGNVVNDTNPGFQPFGFAGGLYDRDTELTRFGFRDYDAYTGRWTSKDPILFASGDINLYGYVQNDPVNRIDPFGLFIDISPLIEGLRNFAEMVGDAVRAERGRRSGMVPYYQQDRYGMPGETNFIMCKGGSRYCWDRHGNLHYNPNPNTNRTRRDQTWRLPEGWGNSDQWSGYQRWLHKEYYNDSGTSDDICRPEL